jgi:hypothetical protein
MVFGLLATTGEWVSVDMAVNWCSDFFFNFFFHLKYGINELIL